MGIRIKPREIEVPRDDPFKNDLLERKQSVEILTQLVGSFEGPCVLAINASWGTGKTTFLRIWAQYLRKNKFPVVEFNAWENDFAEDPFIALSSELTNKLDEYTDKQFTEEKIIAIKNKVKEVSQFLLPVLVRLLTGNILGPDSLATKEISQALASYTEDRLAEYQKTQESIKKFKCALQDMADTLRKSKEHPLIVFIDELDRCRPSYAVELLEIAKHLFTVDNIVFVLAVNRAELAHSIRSLYGNDFDAEGYLHRFFDVDIQLPDPKRRAFIKAMLNSIQIDDYLKRTADNQARRDDEYIGTLLLGFFGTHDFSLRTIAQAIHRLGLVFASLRSDRKSFLVTAVVALILRTANSNLYYRFIRGEASDLEVVDEVFNLPGIKSLQFEREGALFEAIIILAAQEETLSSLNISDPLDSPLLQRYRKLADVQNTETTSLDQNQKHANKVIELVEDLGSKIYGGWSLGFKSSVQRLELLSDELIDKQTEGALSKS